MADIGAEIDTAAKVTKLVGDLATAAATAGPVVLTIAELFLPWIPGLGPVVADIQVAIPIIQQIAKYAPAVQQGLTNGKPLVEAVIGVGEVILGPLGTLSSLFPGVAIGGTLVSSFLKASALKPQDPLFARESGAVD